MSIGYFFLCSYFYFGFFWCICEVWGVFLCMNSFIVVFFIGFVIGFLDFRIRVLVRISFCDICLRGFLLDLLGVFYCG